MKKFMLATAALAAGICTAVPADSQYTAGDFRRITAMTAKLLDHNHYSNAKMTPELSGRIFDIYFDSLDPAHIFFTRQDIARFMPYRETLGNSMQYGEFEFAFQVYSIYRTRYAEYRKFTQKMLSGKIDFNKDEYVSARQSKEPRPANKAEMHELWRKHIKNDLLSFRLMERAEKDEAAKKDKNSPKDTADKKNLPAPKSPAERILQRQRDIGNLVDKRDRIDILGLLLDAMAQAYGAHTDYQPPKLSEDFDIQMSLSLTGIGATLTNENGYIKIVELVPGGPADLSGKLKVNDRIVSVTQENGETVDLIDMPVNKAVQYIRGPKGSKVTLRVLSGSSSVPVAVELIRDKINLSAGAAKGEIKEINGVKVGIINLPSFYMDFDAAMRGDKNARKASTDIKKILDDFKQKSVNSVVIDLRSNGGGSLPDAITISGMFMKGGPVVQVRSKDGVEVENDPSNEIDYAGPLVILTSKGSASAAEIFTGAMRDTKRAVVVGDSRTFGKGTVLRVEDLDRYNSWFGKKLRSGSLTFEMAMFFRPGGSSVQQLGIKPDIQLPSLTEELEYGEIFLDNHLPWDSIAPVKTPVWDSRFDAKVAVLKKKSAERIAKDSNYQAFIRQAALFRTIRDRKLLSLNEETRYAEYRNEKKISEEAEKLMRDDNGNKKDGDVVLKEAVNIAADLFLLEKK